MERRAELVDATRERIRDAAIRLHTTVGPSQTSVSAIAEAAGVTRLTVYRHFPDADALFEACVAHWTAMAHPPDPSTWTPIADLESRARAALAELYAWFSTHHDELYPNYRDRHLTPASSQARLRAGIARQADIVAGTDGTGSGRARRLRAVAGHAVSFWTWRSLTHDQGLSDPEAVDVVVGMLLAVREEDMERRPPSRRGRAPAGSSAKAQQPRSPGRSGRTMKL
jgi:AcrR family transcriptional regulator